MKAIMASTTSNRNHRVILECNNIYFSGTKIIKMFEGVYNEGTVKYYKSENKKYRVVYENGEEEDLTHNEIKNNLKVKRRRRGRVRTRNITSVYGQRNLHGEVLTSKDSDTFGDEFPKSPETNCSIITYQNIGQQPQSRYERKAIETSKAFRMSKASIACNTYWKLLLKTNVCFVYFLQFTFFNSLSIV